ncbi:MULTISPECIES: CBS domain-containing protein [Spirosoma]|uniref:CBS domain-containing protein n=1 Tax=Spirosoma liriopis TaxID=2937440 RepID=A0ABT0HQI7_9BACT|nr:MULTISPECIES: CBS domain-containing protein [Spirosoma]MCK8494432.1 CBS domain-containing protein [Spirosoma liriopis]UHG89441.1 CBS domain-containing protein [Spirosoma oryzicola]
MLAAELIDPMLPALKPTDSVGQALDWMQEHRIGQLVLTDQGDYRGVVSEELLMDVPDSDQPLSSVMRLFEQIYVNEDQHLYEIMGLIIQNRMEVVAVVNEGREFAGTISANELLKQFAQELGVQEPGAILILTLHERDYSMAEVSRLVESNNVKIISSYFSSAAYGMPDRSRLTLKLNRRDITPVISTLERFGYHIEAAFANAPVESIDQERLDSLLRFLNT